MGRGSNGATTYLYVPETSAYLARRWLEEHADTPATLLLEDPREAEAWREAFPSVRRTLSLEQGPTVLSGDQTPTVVVPIAMDHQLLHFHHPVQAPVLAPHYAVIHRLWQLGFRAFTWYTLAGERTFEAPHLLDAFRGRHRGERCFVVGNGPSLAKLDMPRLRDEITLGSNRCFLGYEQWGFAFNYWGIYDRFQIEYYGGEYERALPADTVKFFPLEYLPLLRMENACPLNVAWSTQAGHAFSDNAGRLFVGFTVTHMLLQIAAVMGCNPIVLIGADHRYSLRRRYYAPALRRARRRFVRAFRGGPVYDMVFAAHQAWRKHSPRPRPIDPERLWSTDDALAPTHFDDRYAGEASRRFMPPEPEEAERDFLCAREWAHAHGVEILNATPGSALEVFPRVDFEDLLPR